MKHAKLSFSICALVLSVACFGGLFGFAVKNTLRKVHAEETELSDEDYTDDDRLLLRDGTASKKRIESFAKEVVGAKDGTSFPELTQVLPRDFLETRLIKGVRQYYGKEYGYYIVKDGDDFDVLLIDFKHERSSGTDANEYKIEVKPLFEESFHRTQKGGEYLWTKYSGKRYKYYVAYPRFLTVLKNENALNYGDANYVKENDEGPIVQRSRANFGEVLYAAEEARLETQTRFYAQTFVDMTVDALNTVTPDTRSGGVTGFIKSRLEHEQELFGCDKNVLVEADKDTNIYTNPSKAAQSADVKKSFTRVVGFQPREEIILSSDEDSYANFITLLNDTDYRSRLYQICEFDIVRRIDENAPMEHVAGNYFHETEPSIAFWKEQVLFDDRAPQFQLTEEDLRGSQIPFYLLPHGRQSFRFTPQYSGEYLFEVPCPDLEITIDGAEVVEKGKNAYSAYLTENVPYTIVIRNDEPYTRIDTFICRFTQYEN